MNIKGTSGEVSDGNEEHIIGSWKKGDPYDKMAENLADCVLLCKYYCIFFTHFSVNGHLGGFHVLTDVNGAAVNLGVYVSF